jgi:hypothetical protein
MSSRPVRSSQSRPSNPRDKNASRPGSSHSDVFDRSSLERGDYIGPSGVSRPLTNFRLPRSYGWLSAVRQPGAGLTRLRIPSRPFTLPRGLPGTSRHSPESGQLTKIHLGGGNIRTAREAVQNGSEGSAPWSSKSRIGEGVSNSRFSASLSVSSSTCFASHARRSLAGHHPERFGPRQQTRSRECSRRCGLPRGRYGGGIAIDPAKAVDNPSPAQLRRLQYVRAITTFFSNCAVGAEQSLRQT